MIMTKILFVCAVIAGLVNIMGWEQNKYKKFNYFVMWLICIEQILTRILEG